MTDQAKTEVAGEAAKLLADLREVLEAGSKFILEQAPPLAKEIVTYGRIMHLVWVAVGFLILLSIYKLAPRVKKSWDELDDAFIGVGGMIYFLVGGITAIALILTNIQDAFKAWVAPRLYLLDYIGSLIK